MKDLRQYDLVVLNHNCDAALYRVQSVSGFRVVIQDMEGLSGPQTVDRSLLLRPHKAQLDGVAS